jgi:predicted 3-demethylubiquinone-9 3-methyltransferase (glyoxalase superfamily)
MPSIVANLWFDGQAEEAARFYCSVFPRSRVEGVIRAPADYPGGGKAGRVLTVDFVLDGTRFTAINGGPAFRFSEAVSFLVECDGQAEVDHYWSKLSADPEAEQCGWLRDRYGLSWQVFPKALDRMLRGDDAAGARRAFEAMLSMKKLDVAALEAAYEGRAPQAAARRSA